jgi:hypothetical protein
MYRAGAKKEKKPPKKDVRQSPGHVHNKPHVLIIASHHPSVVSNVSSENEAED